jgi:hypothetical protein
VTGLDGGEVGWTAVMLRLVSRQLAFDFGLRERKVRVGVMRDLPCVCVEDEDEEVSS